jgi:AcrR family transcriptional regulator
MDPRPTPPPFKPPKSTPKSQRTRTRILDAAMRLFAERGYHAVTNADIADAADLTRGAMLYHFATREELAAAAVAHIQAARTAMFLQAVQERPGGVDAADHAIDAYWNLLHELPSAAFRALEAGARSDPGLDALLKPAAEEWDRAELGVIANAVQAGSTPRLQASRDLARFALEGLARAKLTYDDADRTAHFLAVVKRAVHMLNRRGHVTDLWED